MDNLRKYWTCIWASIVLFEVVLGESCMTSEECLIVTNNSRCHQNECRCEAGFFMENTTNTCIPRMIGVSCEVHEDCNFKNSVCDGTCQCETGFYATFSLDTCIKRKLEDICKNDSDCDVAIENSMCSNNLCSCQMGYKPVHHRTLCIENELGDNCYTDSDCKYKNNSVCKNSTCSCSSGFNIRMSNTTCVKTKLFDPCITDSDCTDSIDSSICLNDLCACAIGFIPAFNETYCRLRTLSGDCNATSDCETVVPFSECLNNTCLCVPGYSFVPDVSECVLRTLGDACQFDTDCNSAVNNSECTLNTCVCLQKFVSTDHNTTCMERAVMSVCANNTGCSGATSNTTLPCTNDSDCSGAVSNTTLPCANDSDCSGAITDTTLSCTNNSDCSDAVSNTTLLCANNSDCSGATTNTTLLCTNESDCSGTTSDTTLPCTNDSDCSVLASNSICINSTCRCSTSLKAVKDNSTCKARVLGDRCDGEADCIDNIANSKCISNTCSCKSGFRSAVNQTDCIARAFNDKCVENTECSETFENTVCQNGTCTCRQGYTVVMDKCIPNKINDTCTENSDCSTTVNNSVCRNQTCRCAVGYRVNADNDFCIKHKIYDKTCTVPEDCSAVIPNSNCQHGQCLCNTEFYASHDNKTCEKYKIGDKCKPLVGCFIYYGNCINGECVCQTGYLPVNNNTECKRRVIGDTCSQTTDCRSSIGFRSLCNGTHCICEHPLEPLPNNTKCVSTPTKLSESCTYDDQCKKLDNMSICANDIKRASSCICTNNFLARFDRRSAGECYAPVKIGDYCENRAWCYIWDNVQCSNKSCLCKSGYLSNATDDGCVPYAVTVGEFCRQNTDCFNIIHSECSKNSTCQCHYKYEPGLNRTYCVARPFRFVPRIPYVATGQQCDNNTGGQECKLSDMDQKYTSCALQYGKEYNCSCVPGYASRHDSATFYCEEMQTYFYNIYIALELGCDSETEKDEHLCYLYQPIRVLEQYNDPDTTHYRYIRERIVSSGFANLFAEADPPVRDRYATSEVINITEVDGAMKVGLLIYMSADYFDIINETNITTEIINVLIRTHGEIGKSQMKLVWPFDKAIEYRGFDECSEQNGSYSDCHHEAWCLNTPVSYMCSCQYKYEDWSPDSYKRPGRLCIDPPEVTTDSLSCSNGSCANRWEFISLGLIGFGFLLIFFIGYEIYARKKKLEKSDIYFKIQKAAKKAKLKALRERRKTIKKKKPEDNKDLKPDKPVETKQPSIETV